LRLSYRIVGGEWYEDADTPHRSALLRPRREPLNDGRAAEGKYELPPSNAHCHLPPAQTGSRQAGEYHGSKCGSVALKSPMAVDRRDRFQGADSTGQRNTF